jgi:hypothetical protein
MTLAIAISQSPELAPPAWPLVADGVLCARGEVPLAVAGTEAWGVGRAVAG